VCLWCGSSSSATSPSAWGTNSRERGTGHCFQRKTSSYFIDALFVVAERTDDGAKLHQKGGLIWLEVSSTFRETEAMQLSPKERVLSVERLFRRRSWRGC